MGHTEKKCPAHLSTVRRGVEIMLDLAESGVNEETTGLEGMLHTEGSM